VITYPLDKPPVFCSVCGLRLASRLSPDGTRLYDSRTGRAADEREKSNLVCPSGSASHDSFILAIDEGQPYCWTRALT